MKQGLELSREVLSAVRAVLRRQAEYQKAVAVVENWQAAHPAKRCRSCKHEAQEGVPYGLYHRRREVWKPYHKAQLRLEKALERQAVAMSKAVSNG